MRHYECDTIIELLQGQKVEFLLRYETQRGVCFAVFGGKSEVPSLSFLAYSLHTAIYVAQSTAVTVHRTVTMVLPLFERAASFERFLKDYSEIQKHDNNVALIVVECTSKESPHIAQIALELAESVRFLEISCTNFSRGVMLEKGLNELHSADLFLAVDVDFKFTTQMLHRVRGYVFSVAHKLTILLSSLTQQGISVTLPVCFSLYPQVNVSLTPDGSALSWHGGTGYNEGTGFWRDSGYGMLAAFKADIEAVGGYSDSGGWGGEDVRLARALSLRFEVFRYLEPDFLHLWHPKDCAAAANPKACLDVEAQNRGSQLQLARELDRYRHSYKKEIIDDSSRRKRN